MRTFLATAVIEAESPEEANAILVSAEQTEGLRFMLDLAEEY